MPVSLALRTPAPQRFDRLPQRRSALGERVCTLVVREGQPIEEAGFLQFPEPGYLAIGLGVAFLIAGFVGILAPSAAPVTGALAAIQVIWIIAAAIAFPGYTVLGSGPPTEHTQV
jgi:hypothetical protein